MTEHTPPTSSDYFRLITEMEDSLTILESFGELLTALSCGNVDIDRGCLHYLAQTYQASFEELQAKWEAAVDFSRDAKDAEPPAKVAQVDWQHIADIAAEQLRKQAEERA